MGAKERGNDQYIEIKITHFDFLHKIAYGQPACAMIENEYGITPRSCMTKTEKLLQDNQQRLKMVQQSIEDTAQHYDIDGVSRKDD